MLALCSALKTVPIYGPGGGGDAAGSAANPNYSVSISDSEAKENAHATAEARESARLVPTKKIQEAKEALSPIRSQPGPGAGLSAKDTRIIDDLTSRNPASDPSRDEAWASGRDDSSTLGRPSIDHQDLEDVRGLLRRESTRGKRKASNDPRGYGGPSIPTISEPSPTVSYNDYAQDTAYSGAGYGRPQPPPVQSSFASQLPRIQPLSSPIEMSQVGRSTSQVSRSTSNPYRTRSEQPLSPPGGGLRQTREEEGEDENTRPYSGV